MLGTYLCKQLSCFADEDLHVGTADPIRFLPSLRFLADRSSHRYECTLLLW